MLNNRCSHIATTVNTIDGMSKHEPAIVYGCSRMHPIIKDTKKATVKSDSETILRTSDLFRICFSTSKAANKNTRYLYFYTYCT